MSSRSRNRARQRRLEKSTYAVAARATGARTRTLTQAEIALAAGQQPGVSIGQFQPLGRTDPYQVPFGPLTPLVPYAIDPLGVDGRTPPRLTEYQVGWNIPGAGERHLAWEVLEAASHVGVVRDCISNIQTELTGLDWGIVVSEDAVAAAMETDGLRKVEAKKTLREKLAPDMARARAFWQRPNPGDGQNFEAWFWTALEETLVRDALPIYPELTYGNDVLGLVIVDGSFIKPLRNHLGRRPQPPDPSYQQIMYGFPRGEFLAAQNEDGTVDGAYSADELVYAVRSMRTKSPYGISPVEKALTSINLWLKRMEWMTREYDSSSIPSAFLELPMESQINSPTEMRRWQEAYNNKVAGDLAQRQNVQLGPPGAKLSQYADAGEKYKPEYDTYIMKLVCMAFSITPAEVGFVETGGLGGASYHDGAESIQYRKMILPWCRFFQGIFNDISHRYLGIDPAVEFRFLGLEEEDEAEADATLLARVQSGRMTLNEARDEQGKAPFDFVEADEPYILARTGVTFLRGLQAVQEATAEAQMAGANQAAHNLSQPQDDPGAEDPGSPTNEDAEGDEDDDQQDAAPAKPAPKPAPAKTPTKTEKSAGDPVSELDSFVRWAAKVAKTGKSSRPFAFATVDEATARTLNHLVLDDAPADAASLAKAIVADLRKGGGGGGRRPGPPAGRRAEGLAGVPGPHASEPEVRRSHLVGCQPIY